MFKTEYRTDPPVMKKNRQFLVIELLGKGKEAGLISIALRETYGAAEKTRTEKLQLAVVEGRFPSIAIAEVLSCARLKQEYDLEDVDIQESF